MLASVQTPEPNWIGLLRAARSNVSEVQARRVIYSQLGDAVLALIPSCPTSSICCLDHRCDPQQHKKFYYVFCILLIGCCRARSGMCAMFPSSRTSCDQSTRSF